MSRKKVEFPLCQIKCQVMNTYDVWKGGVAPWILHHITRRKRVVIFMTRQILKREIDPSTQRLGGWTACRVCVNDFVLRNNSCCVIELVTRGSIFSSRRFGEKKNTTLFNLWVCVSLMTVLCPNCTSGLRRQKCDPTPAPTAYKNGNASFLLTSNWPWRKCAFEVVHDY